MFKRKKRRKAKDDTLLTPENLRRGLVIGGSIVVFGAAAVVVLVEAPRMERRLVARATTAPPTVVIDWPVSPGANATWLPPEERDSLLAAAYRELARHPDPLSAEALASIAHALDSTGWFHHIHQVRREAGNTVRIEGVWRTPAAVVRRGDVDYLIARNGELLPIAYPIERAPLPAIVGAKFDPPMQGGKLAYGKPWPGADLRAGLEVLALVNTRPWREQVAAIDVSEYLGSRRLALVTQWEGRAIWGGAPSDAIPGEVSAEMKLHRLDVLHRQYQRIDARRRIVEVSGPVTLVDDSAAASAS